MATVPDSHPPTTIPQRELRNNVSEVLRRAEAGERIKVTINGRPVAEVGPIRSEPRRFTGADLQEIVEQSPVNTNAWLDELWAMREEDRANAVDVWVGR